MQKSTLAVLFVLLALCGLLARFSAAPPVPPGPTPSATPSALPTPVATPTLSVVQPPASGPVEVESPSPTPSPTPRRRPPQRKARTFTEESLGRFRMSATGVITVLKCGPVFDRMGFREGDVVLNINNHGVHDDMSLFYSCVVYEDRAIPATVLRGGRKLTFWGRPGQAWANQVRTMEL